MTHFALIATEDPDARRAFAASAIAELATCDGVAVSEAAAGPVWAGWSSAPSAPVTVTRSGEDLTIAWGTPLAPDEGDAVAPAPRRERGREASGGGCEAFDGYFASVRLVAGTLEAFADRLGVFPVYWTAVGADAVLASSPRLVHAHAGRPLLVDARGLLGILLTQGPVRGRTLSSGVRRLGAGASLVWSRGETRERPGWSLPRVERDTRTPPEEQIERLHVAAARAVERQLGPPEERESWALLLSGGRDSRLLAGYARGMVDGQTRRPPPAGARPDRVPALVLGRDGDHEVRLARQAARALGLAVRRYEIPPEAYARAAAAQARWEHLAGGVSTVHMGGVADPLSALAPRVLSGYLADGILGGMGLFPPSHPASSFTFEDFFPRLTRRALDPGALRALLRPPLASAVEEVVAEIREDYEAAWPDPSERLWRYLLAHAERFQIGGIPHRIASGAWPVLPVLDGAVLELAATMDPRVLGERRAQDEILRRHFPALARIPHTSQNADPAPPLLAGPLPQLAARLRARWGPDPGDRARRRERRYNWFAYDFNGPGWREIRRRAEPHREAVADLFVMERLADVLPGPETTTVSHTFFDQMGRQLLVGLMLWAGLNR